MKCKTCGKNCDKEYCFQHKPRKPLEQSRMIRHSSSSKKAVNEESIIQMREFFLSIWKKRRHYSEISGEFLGNEPLTTYFHHILAKKKYPEVCLDEDNIVILSLLEHSDIENDMYKYEEVNKRREQLKIKYNIL